MNRYVISSYKVYHFTATKQAFVRKIRSAKHSGSIPDKGANNTLCALC